MSVASWNIQGLGNAMCRKLDDNTFINEISKHHIVGLQETHATVDTQIVVNGYHSCQVVRPKSKNVSHGGIAILVKNELRKAVKFYQSPTPDFAWVKLDQTFFGLEKDLIIGFIYIYVTLQFNLNQKAGV